MVGLVCDNLSTRDLRRFKANISETKCRKGRYISLQSLTLAHPKHDSEFVSSVESESRRNLKVSKKFESAIKTLHFKTAVSTKWKWGGDKIEKL